MSRRYHLCPSPRGKRLAARRCTLLRMTARRSCILQCLGSFLFSLVAATGLMVLVGCGSRAVAPSFELSADDYAEAFDAARDVLRERGFELDRVDARAGVITTAPRASAGLATPWIQHSPTLREASGATLHPDRRMAIVSFAPVGAPSPVSDLREHDGGFLLAVEAPKLRLRRVGRHLDSTAIRFANWWRDPSEPDPMVLTPVEAADDLAADLADRIRARLAQP